MNKSSMRAFLFILLAAAAFGGDAKILTNHVGYEAGGAKRAVVLGGAGDVVTSFAVLDAASGRAVLSGRAREAGAVRNWKDWRFWTVDFCGVSDEGTYVLEGEVNGKKVRSEPFAVAKNALERHTLSDVVYYFKGQRSSGLLDKADRTMTFESERKGTVDVHGGWFDASGDYGKHLSHLSFSTYFNPQQNPSGRLEPRPRLSRTREAERPELPPISPAASRRGPVRRGLPRSDQEPGRLVLSDGFREGPGEET